MSNNLKQWIFYKSTYDQIIFEVLGELYLQLAFMTFSLLPPEVLPCKYSWLQYHKCFRTCFTACGFLHVGCN